MLQLTPETALTVERVEKLDILTKSGGEIVKIPGIALTINRRRSTTYLRLKLDNLGSEKMEEIVFKSFSLRTVTKAKKMLYSKISVIFKRSSSSTKFILV